MDSPELNRLFRHMAWADAAVWAAVSRLPDLPPGDDVDPEAATDAHRLRELFHHVHAVQWAYLRILRGEAPEIPELGAFDDLDTIRAWGREVHEGLAAFVDHLDAAVLERPVDFPWADALVERYGPSRPADVREALLQLPSHSSYHRGQINALVRRLGGEPPLVDFIVWVWMEKPDAVWAAV